MVAIHVPCVCVCCHHAGTYQIYRILAWCTCVATDNINFYPDLRKTTNFVTLSLHVCVVSYIDCPGSD